MFSSHREFLLFSSTSTNCNSSRRPLIAPKLRTINSNEQLSSSDSSGSIRKTLLDKSTMTITEKTPTSDFYSTWNKSTRTYPIFSSSNNSDSYNENIFHDRNITSNEKIFNESLLKQKMCSSKKYNHTSLPLDRSKYSSLQKPRVYTYDDPKQNIIKSSSESSTLSFKDKNLNEIGQTKYCQIFILISVIVFFKYIFLKILFNSRWM